MAGVKKVTVDVPEDLLRRAQETTGQGVTATIRTGLQLVAATGAGAKEGPRWAAVKRLTDRALVAQIADTDKDEDVRKAARERLEEMNAGATPPESIG